METLSPAGSDEKKLQHYEMLYILPVKYTVDELPAIQNKVKGILAEHGCIVTYDEDMGKRKMAYAIKQVFHGYYFVTEFNMDSAELTKLNNSLRLAPEVLRHLVVLKKELTKEQIAAERERRERAEAQEVAKLKERIESRTPATPAEKKEEAKKVASKTKAKVSIEDLDKKLDELIDETIL